MARLDTAARDRALGAMLGLAVGDALGTPLEFTRRDTKPPVTGMRGGGPFGLKPGEWTDDTSMALCLAESLIAHAGALDPDDLMRRFGRWYREGENSVTGRCFDIGNITRSALEQFERTGETADASPPDPQGAGNGTLMRLAPVVLAAAPDAARAAELADAQSRTTHAAPVAHEACQLFAAMLVEAIGGATKSEVLRAREAPGDLAPVGAGSWKRKGRRAIVSSGYVVATLEAALWCVWKTETFADAVLLAANLGDDADTVAAVTGQLAGALYGRSGILPAWLEQLAWRETIEELATRLVDLVPGAEAGATPDTGDASEEREGMSDRSRFAVSEEDIIYLDEYGDPLTIQQVHEMRRERRRTEVRQNAPAGECGSGPLASRNR